MPRTINVNSKTLTCDYDALAIKYKYSNGSSIVKYAGVFEYDGSNVLKRIAISEGQVVPSGDTLAFQYYRAADRLKDHLGNVRVVFDENGDILQETDYYPFGLAIARDNPAQSENIRNTTNRFLYNEKELQIGTGYLDYGARMYMPEIGRWGGVDPLAEKDRRWSPYSYGNNNPLRFIDPDGREIVDSHGKPIRFTRNEDGNLKWSDNATKDVAHLGNAMAQTEIEMQLLQQLSDSEMKVQMEVSAELKYEKIGEKNNLRTGYASPSENTAISDYTITIYEKAIEQHMTPFMDQEGKSYDKGVNKAGEIIYYKNYTLDEHMGANAMHEATHVLDPQSRRSFYKNSGKNNDEIFKLSEDKPAKNELKHYKQIQSKR